VIQLSEAKRGNRTLSTLPRHWKGVDPAGERLVVVGGPGTEYVRPFFVPVNSSYSIVVSPRLSVSKPRRAV
jgi:hypothetical protein